MYQVLDRGRRKFLFRYAVYHNDYPQQYFAWKWTAKRYIKEEKAKSNPRKYGKVVWEE